MKENYTKARAMGLSDCNICGAVVAVAKQSLHDHWHGEQAAVASRTSGSKVIR